MVKEKNNRNLIEELVLIKFDKIKNFINSYGVNIIILFVSFFQTKYFLRILGTETFGIYGYVVVIAGYINVFSSELQNYTLLKYLSKEKNDNSKIYSKNIFYRIIISFLLLPIGVYLLLKTTKNFFIILILFFEIFKTYLPKKILDVEGYRNIALRVTLTEKIGFIFGLFILSISLNNQNLNHIILPCFLSLSFYYIYYLKNFNMNFLFNNLHNFNINLFNKSFVINDLVFIIIPFSYMMQLGFIRFYAGFNGLFVELASINILISLANVGSTFINLILRGRIKKLIFDNGLFKKSVLQELFFKLILASLIYLLGLTFIGPFLLKFITSDTDIIINPKLLPLTGLIIIMSVVTDMFNQIALISNRYSSLKIYGPVLLGSLISFLISIFIINNNLSLFYVIFGLNIGLFIMLLVQIFFFKNTIYKDIYK